MSQSTWFVYFVRCRDGEIYTGIATDVARRFAEHEAGGARSARFLRGRGPLELVTSLPAGSRSSALKIEARLKKLPRRTKLALLANEHALALTVQALLEPAD